MIAMDTLLLALFISSLGASVQQATCQDVEIRAPSVVEAQADLDRGSGGGQSRTIYSQRHLSPHRMMHFGKRPANGLPPSISAPASYFDLMPAYAAMASAAPMPARQAILQQRQQQGFVADTNYLPFQFSIELENGQRLRAVPEDALLQAQGDPAKNLLYNYIGRLPADQLTFAAALNGEDAIAKREQQLLRQLIGQRQAESGGSQRFSKLMADDESKSSGFNDEVNNSQSSERAQDSSNNQEQPNAINISTRSMHSPSRSNVLSLPKAYVSTLLYGRQGSSSMPNFGAFNKKAEPKENFFMHFGRK